MQNKNKLKKNENLDKAELNKNRKHIAKFFFKSFFLLLLEKKIKQNTNELDAMCKS